MRRGAGPGGGGGALTPRGAPAPPPRLILAPCAPTAAARFVCPPNRPFRCKNDRVCLWIGRQCDGTDNCGDGTDEEDCGEQGASGRSLAPVGARCALVWVLPRGWGVGRVRTAPGEGEEPRPGARGHFLGREKPREKAREASWRLGLEVELGTLNV